MEIRINHYILPAKAIAMQADMTGEFVIITAANSDGDTLAAVRTRVPTGHPRAHFHTHRAMNGLAVLMGYTVSQDIDTHAGLRFAMPLENPL